MKPLSLLARKSLLFPICMFLLLCQACQPPSQEPVVQEEAVADQEVQPLRYAKLFSISRKEGYTRVDVFAENDLSGVPVYRYVLVPRGLPVPEHDPGDMVVRVPLRRVTCESGFQISLIELIGSPAALVGVSGKVRVGQDWVHRKIDDRSLAVTGFMRSINMETLVALNPDMAFVNASSVGSDIPVKIQSYGLVPGVFAASLEAHPLGALEWIRFMGAFFCQDNLAEEIFREKEAAYLQVQQWASGVRERPGVIAGYSRKGTWSTMGSSRWFVSMLDHAGADYRFRDHELERGHMLSGEVAMQHGATADFWVNTSFRVSTLQELLADEPRYVAFRSVQNRTVYNNNNSCFENGRSKFWDIGMTEPDKILADLITIFHPELANDHQLHYYRRLE